MMKTKLGSICLECGFGDVRKVREAPPIKMHAELVHHERRSRVPVRSGHGRVAELTNLRRPEAGPGSPDNVFSWVRVGAAQFSYYAAVFVLLIALGGVSYHYFEMSPSERASQGCHIDIAETSADSTAAAVLPSVTPTPEPCTP